MLQFVTRFKFRRPARGVVSAVFVTTLVSFIGFSMPSGAAEPVHISTWDHNGSTMIMEKHSRHVEIRYENVSDRMRRAGVRSGNVLFSGRINQHNRLIGEAYVFRRGCDPVGYDVRGRFTPDVGQDEIVLRGAAPIRARQGCDVVDYSRSRNAGRLLFTLIGQDGHGGREEDFEGQEDAANDPATEPPSFDCRPYVGSGQCPEVMICDSARLSSHDALMGRLYEEVLSLSRSASERQSYRDEQRASLKERNACGCDHQCLEQWYYMMNKSLGKTTVILRR